jgi:hypothetical protein
MDSRSYFVQNPENYYPREKGRPRALEDYLEVLDLHMVYKPHIYLSAYLAHFIGRSGVNLI